MLSEIDLPNCRTFISFAMLPAETEILVERSLVVGLLWTVKEIFPFPFVTDATAVNQGATLLMLQLVLLETVTSDVPPSAVNNSSEEETDSFVSTVSASFF